MDDKKLQNRPEPELKTRISAALFIAAFGVDCGCRTQFDLMWPFAEWDDHDDAMKRVAARLLASVHTAVLEVLPPERIAHISKDLSSYLSFACGDGWPDDNSPSLEGKEHPPA